MIGLLLLLSAALASLVWLSRLGAALLSESPERVGEAIGAGFFYFIIVAWGVRYGLRLVRGQYSSLGAPSAFFFWTGHGYVVIPLALIARLSVQLPVDLLMGAGTYTAATWPKFLAFATLAVVCGYVGVRLDESRVSRAETDSKPSVPMPRSRFFGVPVRYAGAAIGILASLALLATRK